MTRFHDGDGDDKEENKSTEEGGPEAGKYGHDAELNIPDSEQAIDNSQL